MPPVMDDRSESAVLLEAVRGGSVEALGELYRRYGELVYGAAVRLTGSHEEAEDVLQDVFVGLPRALRNYRESHRFEGWLRRVAVRTALMRMRAVRRKREAPLDDTTTAPPGAHPLDRVALERAVGALPDSFRVVFVLKEIEGYSHAEIASLLGISSAASATRLSRAWAILRQKVAP
jgi:RNA polymerase sigma-70 factor (ECF subfamily)